MVMATFVAYDGCAVYGQITTNQTALMFLSYYNTSEVMQVLGTCYYPPPNSTDTIFDSFNQLTNFIEMQQIQTQYNTALPGGQFFSVSKNIANQLINYAANPNDVNLVGANAAQNPQAALNSANQYASNGGSLSCSAVNDTFAYNPTDCYPLLLNQAAGTSSCILIEDSSATIVLGRQASFTSHNCASNFNTYQNNFNALNAYGDSVSALTASYLNDGGLSTYTTNYYNYYMTVSKLMNDYTQSLFQSFLGPYQSLIGGSSCTYLTTVLNSLVNNTCNNNFPYIYALSILTIIMTCFFFVLMILAYYLTVRMEFYEFLNGDLGNYDQHAGSE
jgi:hypothetical protein